MRPEWRLGIGAAVGLAVGALGAEPGARLAAPFYAAIDRLIATSHPWAIEQVAVVPEPGRGAVLRLLGDVRRTSGDPKPAAMVVSRLEVGEAIEPAIVFWTVLLVWPAARSRERWVRVAGGLVVFLGLELVTAAQLLHPLAEASALLARGPASVPVDDPLTLWERASRFLEAGGTFAVAAAGALAAIGGSHFLTSRPRAD